MKVMHLTQEHAFGVSNFCGEGEPTPRDYKEVGDEVVCLGCAKALTQKYKYLNSVFSQYHNFVSLVTTAAADVMEAHETGHERTDATPQTAMYASTMDMKAKADSGQMSQNSLVESLLGNLEEQLKDRGA